MKKSSWSWITPRPAGLSKYGPRWLRPLAVAVPWITVLLLLLMLWMISGTLTAAKGVIFELPAGDQIDGDATPLVALVVPSVHGTQIFFDDARFPLDDSALAESFGGLLKSRISTLDEPTLVVMADRRVAGGDLMRVAAIARSVGIRRLLLANQAEEAKGE